MPPRKKEENFLYVLAAAIISTGYFIPTRHLGAARSLTMFLEASVFYCLAFAVLGTSKLVWRAKNRKYKSTHPDYYAAEKRRCSQASWYALTTVCQAFVLIKLLATGKLFVPDMFVLILSAFHGWDLRSAYQKYTKEIANERINMVLDTLHDSIDFFPYHDVKSYIFSCCVGKCTGVEADNSELEYVSSKGWKYTARPNEPVLFTFVCLGRYAVDYDREELRQFVDSRINSVRQNSHYYE